jgi:hypothetical protein
MPRKKRSNEGGSVLHALLSTTIWIAGVLVSLAVGFGMVDGTLGVRFVHESITAVAGWIVVILTLLGVLFAILDKLSR